MCAEKETGKSLGETLVEENLITSEQLGSAMEMQRRQGGRLGEILINQGLVRAEELATALSIQLNMPLIDLKRHVVQPDALRLIPEDMARKYKLIPLDVINGSLMVVMADPEDIRTIEDIKAQAKMRVEVALGIRSDIERAIDLNYGSSSKINKQMEEFAPAAKQEETDPSFSVKTPIAETLELLITQAVSDRASDIHIEPQEDRLRIRYRIDGILHDRFTFPMTTHAQLVSRVKILAEMNIAEQSAFPGEINSTRVINSILELAEEYGVKAIPLVTEPWSAEKVGEHDYLVFRLNVSYSGSFEALLGFTGELENGDFKNVVVESLSVTGTGEQSGDELLPEEETAVGASLDLAVYTGPLLND